MAGGEQFLLDICKMAMKRKFQVLVGNIRINIQFFRCQALDDRSIAWSPIRNKF